VKKPVILVVNDDGIDAPGIKALIDMMLPLGDVTVVAPDSPQSGMGHAITIGKPLRLDKVHIYPGVEMYKCSGTPVDYVKLAVNKIFKGKKPDLCVSGINHGLNNSINVIYSGTMSAAVEASIEGIPAIGFSLLDYAFEADFSAAKHYARELAIKVLAQGLPEKTLLNVNFPKLPLAEIKGMRVCRQAQAKWVEEFEERLDPRGKKYFWMTGRFQNEDAGIDTDEWALANNFVSVVPVQFDLTAHHAMSHINQLLA